MSNNPKIERRWEPGGACCVAGCAMTLVTDFGGGQKLCWLHALWLGLPISASGLAGVTPVK